MSDVPVPPELSAIPESAWAEARRYFPCLLYTSHKFIAGLEARAFGAFVPRIQTMARGARLTP